MEQKLSDTLVKAIDRSNPMMQNLQLASRFNKLVEEGGGADLEDNHEIEITENGTVEITPTEGKNGMKKVTATVNVATDFSSLEAIWVGNSDTANVGDEITISVMIHDISNVCVGVEGAAHILRSAKLSDVINAGVTGVELVVRTGPGGATIKVTAASSGTTYTITFTVTSADEHGVVKSFSAFVWK